MGERAGNELIHAGASTVQGRGVTVLETLILELPPLPAEYAVLSAVAAVQPANAFTVTAISHAPAIGLAALLLSRVHGFGFNNPPPEE